MFPPYYLTVVEDCSEPAVSLAVVPFLREQGPVGALVREQGQGLAQVLWQGLVPVWAQGPEQALQRVLLPAAWLLPVPVEAPDRPEHLWPPMVKPDRQLPGVPVLRSWVPCKPLW